MPHSLSYIQHYTGKEITVKTSNGSTISGTLSFFNFDTNAIHLTRWTVLESEDDNELGQQGQFMMVNNSEWKVVKGD